MSLEDVLFRNKRIRGFFENIRQKDFEAVIKDL